jgi:hypothetical protein
MMSPASRSHGPFCGGDLIRPAVLEVVVDVMAQASQNRG